MSREFAEREIGRMFGRQGRLNSYLVLGFIRLQIEAQTEVPEIDKIREIVNDLIFDRGEYSFHDLLTALNEENFSEERKVMFNTCLELIGIKE